MQTERKIQVSQIGTMVCFVTVKRLHGFAAPELFVELLHPFFQQLIETALHLKHIMLFIFGMLNCHLRKPSGPQDVCAKKPFAVVLIVGSSKIANHDVRLNLLFKRASKGNLLLRIVKPFPCA